MAHSNISIFVPHAGCPHTCSFCNQRTISGSQKLPHGNDVKEICQKALTEIKNLSETEIAFFGGSFTAIPRSYMLELLKSAEEFVGEGKFKGIRISTRPDYIDSEILEILRQYRVTAIELGAQSMCDSVLIANERGHTAQQAEKSAKMIKEFGCFELGMQMMTGLYRSSIEEDRETWEKICALNPDTVRIYPVVILKGTRLGELFLSGEYKPYDFEQAVELCADFIEDAKKRNIKIIKLGLHASETVEEDMLGGFYHPAFREICESRIYRREFENAIKNAGKNIEYACFAVNDKCLSKALGQKKSNAEYFKKSGIELKIIPEKGLKEKMKLIDYR